MGHRAIARRRVGQGMRAGAPDVVLILGDIGEMRKKAEGANNLKCLARWQIVQRRFQIAARRNILVSTKANRVLPNVLDGVEDSLTACSRTVSPSIRPSSRISSRSGRSLSSVSLACCFGISVPLLDDGSHAAVAGTVPYRSNAKSVAAARAYGPSIGPRRGALPLSACARVTNAAFRVIVNLLVLAW